MISVGAFHDFTGNLMQTIRRGICPSCGGRRMAETAAWLVDRVIPQVPVRQWVLSFPIPLRSLFAVHPELLAPVLQIIHRVIATHLIKQAGIKRSEAATGAVTLIQRFGSAANLNIHLHGLVLDGVYHTGAEGAPVFRPAPALTGEELQALLGKIITRVLRLLTREGHLVEEEGVTDGADAHGIVDPDTTCSHPCKRPPALTASRSGRGRGAKC